MAKPEHQDSFLDMCDNYMKFAIPFLPFFLIGGAATYLYAYHLITSSSSTNPDTSLSPTPTNPAPIPTSIPSPDSDYAGLDRPTRNKIFNCQQFGDASPKALFGNLLKHPGVNSNKPLWVYIHDQPGRPVTDPSTIIGEAKDDELCAPKSP